MFAFASGKSVLYLLAIFKTAFLLCSSVGFWFGQHIHSSGEQYPESITAIFSTRTIDALNQDARLHNALFSFTHAIAQSSTDLGERFRLEGLKEFGINITNAVSHVSNKQQPELRRRGAIGDLSDAIGNLTGTGGLNLTGGITGLLSSLGDSMAGSLGTPALFLGIGLGMGTTTALNLTDIQEASAVAIKIASTYNASATGANLAAQNLGSGLAGQITSSFDNTNVSLGMAMYALASGVGNATAFGLGLTQQQYAPSKDMSVEGLAGNFGLGIAKPIASKIDLQAVMKSLGESIGASRWMEQLPQVASAAGTGLGEGARNGLGLAATGSSSTRNRKRQLSNNTLADVDVPEVVGSFAKGLSQSFFKGSNLTNLNLAVDMILPNTIDLQAMLRPFASGAGAGIGMGFAIGFNLKPADAAPILAISSNSTSHDEQIALAAEGFTQNLFSNFLKNSTALKQAKEYVIANPPQVFKDADGAKAAEGLARGIVEGAMNAMSSVGGIKNLISGNIPNNAFEDVPVLAPTQFNDSLNGFAVGFARGLSGKATILIAEIARNFTRSSTAAAPPQKRSLDGKGEEFGVVSYNSLPVRQTQATSSTQIPIAIDAGTAQKGAQKLIDTLSCQGIGGIASAAFGAMTAAKAKAGLMAMMNMGSVNQSSTLLDPTVLQALPRGPIMLSSEGNSFEIVIENQSLKVNGLAPVPFAVLTGLHVLFAGLAFLTFLPLYLVLGVVWRFSVLAGYPVDEAKNKKWRMGFLITFAILGVSGILLGIVGMGNASHFRDTHGIMGLVCLVLLLPAVILSIMRLGSSLPHPASSAFAGIKGPIALARTPQRIYLFSGILTQLLLGLGQFTFLQGFSTLRAISLCIVDAVLTSAAVAGPISLVLMIQISATALVGIRAWLEQHIAKKEAASISRAFTSAIEFRKPSRTDTIATFGFDLKPHLLHDDLRGSEDGGISTPFNVRKEGSINSNIVPNPPPRPDRFLSPEEKLSYQTRGVYNPKTGGYIYTAFSPYEPRQAEIGVASAYMIDRRRSSDLFDPLRPPRPLIQRSSIYNSPGEGVITTQDFWPPPPPISQMYMAKKSVVSSAYSQSGVGWNGLEPVMDSCMGYDDTGRWDESGGRGAGGNEGFGQGFGREPVGTIREKR